MPTIELGHPVKATVRDGSIAPHGLPAPVRGKPEAACAKAVNNDAYKRPKTPLIYRDAATFGAFVAAEARSYDTLVQSAKQGERLLFLGISKADGTAASARCRAFDQPEPSAPGHWSFT